MKLKISTLQIIIIFTISAIAILLTQETLLLSGSSDTVVYFEFNQYKCYGTGFSEGNYWNKPYEFFYDILSIFYCSDTYKNYVSVSYLYFFWTFFIFITIFYKKYGFLETFIFIIIFFLAINPNHLVSQGRQLGSFFLFFSGLLLIGNSRKFQYLFFLASFLSHNNMMIFSVGVYIINNLKLIFNFAIRNFLKLNFLLIIFLFLLIISSLPVKEILGYIIKNGIYIFNLYGDLGFSDRLVGSFSKYLFFVQVFTISFILFLRVRSEVINYMAVYTYIVFFMTVTAMIYKFNFDMMIFRLLYPVKYVFTPLCFVYFYRKIMGKNVQYSLDVHVP